MLKTAVKSRRLFISSNICVLLSVMSLLNLLNVDIGGALQLRRIWLQDHCQNGICSHIEIGVNDYVIMSHAPIAKQLMLTFVNSSIAKIPNLLFDTFPDLQVLRLENCSMVKFEKPQFENADHLMTLCLGNNLLKEIPKNIFQGADKLHTLQLNHNHIDTVYNASFHALKELLELNLAGNYLTALPNGVFSTMRKLISLNLADNRLTLLPKHIFDRNLNLSRIHLAGNQFKVFDSLWFKAQSHISLLDISRNNLFELTINFPLLETFIANSCDLRKLTTYGVVNELELRNNSLREMPHIANANNVTSLDLSQNPFGSLRGNPFRRFSNLLRLNLSAINMHDLAEGIFKKQTQLKSLDISSNSLYNLKFIMFDNLKSLQEFHFQQNNWNCDFLQLLMNSFVKRRDISFMEDIVAPELVDDYVDGIACWYENNKNSKACGEHNSQTDAAIELSIVRNDIKANLEAMDKKFNKLLRLIEEIKMRL